MGSNTSKLAAGGAAVVVLGGAVYLAATYSRENPAPPSPSSRAAQVDDPTIGSPPTTTKVVPTTTTTTTTTTGRPKADDKVVSTAPQVVEPPAPPPAAVASPAATSPSQPNPGSVTAGRPVATSPPTRRPASPVPAQVVTSPQEAATKTGAAPQDTEPPSSREKQAVRREPSPQRSEPEPEQPSTPQPQVTQDQVSEQPLPPSDDEYEDGVSPVGEADVHGWAAHAGLEEGSDLATTAARYLEEHLNKLAPSVCRVETHLHPKRAGTGFVFARHAREIAVVTSANVLPDRVTAESSVLVFPRPGGDVEIKLGKSPAVYRLGRMAIVLTTAPDDSLVPIPCVPFQDHATADHSPITLALHYGGSRKLRVSRVTRQRPLCAGLRPGAAGAPCVTFVGMVDRVLPWCQGVAVAEGGAAAIDDISAAAAPAPGSTRRSPALAARQASLALVKGVRRMLVTRSYVSLGRLSADECAGRLASAGAAVGVTEAAAVCIVPREDATLIAALR